MGILICPENVIHAKRAGLSAIPIRDVDKVVDISQAWHQKTRNPAVEKFLTLLSAP
jgi:DNA-binding transcriptional LysR family regulator